MDIRFQAPFTAIIAGNTSCGKTTFLKKFLASRDKLVNVMFSKIVWCYGVYQEEFMHFPSYITFHEGIPDFEEMSTCGKHILVILDDVMDKIDENVTLLFCKYSHHKLISVFLCLQNLFFKNPQIRTLSLNSHYIIVFKNPRDKSQIIHLAKQMYPGDVGFLKDAYTQATRDAYGYLLIDLRQTSPEAIRLRTGILPHETSVAFIPKNGKKK
jgi:hypothetical protein